jgi:hypothetical protein
MSCLFGCIAFLVPRVVLVAMFFSGFIDRAYETRLWPLLGFVFMPLTTIAYAWAHLKHGSVEGVYFVVVLLAVLADIGVIGGGARGRYREDD